MFIESVSYPAALLAGVLSFFSPCILPLIPAYFSFISGYSLEELTAAKTAALRNRVIFTTILFILGFSTVFILLGASASLLGGLMSRYKDYVRIVGGAVIILLGLHFTGIIRIGRLDVEKKILLREKPLHFFGTFLIGMAFGAGWSPCIGPLLGSILIMAGNQETIGQGMILLGVYSLGLAVPFMVLSIFINFLLLVIAKMKRAVKILHPAAGILLIIMGLFLVTDNLSLLARI